MTLASYELGEGMATFGLALPRGAAHAVQVGDLETQTDVKVQWEDGSIRHAAVHAQVPTGGTYELRAVPRTVQAPPPVPAWPAVTTELLVKNADGTTTKYTAPMPTAALTWLADPWFVGPVANEARALVVPKAGTVEHPSLRVRYDRRQYFPSGRRLSVAVENMLDVPETDLVTYDIAVKVGGAVAYARQAVAHHSFSRWRPEPFLLDGLRLATVVPDFEPFYASRALLRPLVAAVPDTVLPMDAGKFDILSIGDLQPYQAAPGGRPEIGPYPAWVQRYLAHKRPEQLAYLLKMGENVSGAWSMHICWPDDRPVTLDNVVKPDANAWTWGNGSGPKNGKVGRKFGPEAGSAHQPSLAFVPYVVTADRFHLDEMRAWAHYAFMGWGPFGRRATEGIIAYQQTRGIGWALRDLSDFIAYAPDTDTDRPYFLEKVKNNLRELDVQASTGKDPLGSLRPTGSYIAVDAATIQSQVPLWQNDYLAWGLHHALSDRGLGPEGSVARDRLVRYHLQLFTSPEWRREDATHYWYFVTRHEPGNPPHASLAAMWRYNFEEPDPETGKPRKPSHTSILPGYAVDARLLVLVAVDLGLPGAQEAYDYIMAAVFAPTQGIPAGWAMLDDLKRRVEFALAPYPQPEPKAPPPPPDTRTWQVTESGADQVVLRRL